MTRSRHVIATLALALLGSWGGEASATPGSTILKSLGKYFAKMGAKESAEKVTKELGSEVVERVAARTLKEGSEDSLEQISTLVAKNGPDIVRALDNSPAVKPILRSLDELPVEDVPKAAARLAAGKEGKELAEVTIKHGSSALRAELAQPGLGAHFVKALGDDGASLCGKLTKDQAIALGRYVDDLATVPAPQRQSLLELINKDKDRFFAFLGRFAEKNPGATIGSAAVLAVLLPNAERILGGDEVVIDPDGKPTVVSKPGLLGRAGSAVNDSVVNPVMGSVAFFLKGIVAIVLVFGALLSAIKLRGIYRRDRHIDRNSEPVA